MTRLTPQQLIDRAEALEECAEHLGMSWTDSDSERAEGDKLAILLRREAEEWRYRAARFSGWPDHFKLGIAKRKSIK